MAIIMRNGLEADFDPNKMRAGELAIVTDARELHATFAPGDSPKVLLDGEAVPNPETAGTEGQVLALDENGDPEWKSVAAPSDAQVEAAVTDWLDEHPEATTTVEDGAITYAKLDSNLKGTVDDVGELKSELEQAPGLTNVARTALLACFAHVEWTGTDGQTYYDALEEALSGTYPRLRATFTQGADVYYSFYSLETLKANLIVTYWTDEETYQTITNYALSGLLTAGVSSITVAYNGLTAVFTVNVSNLPLSSDLCYLGFNMSTDGHRYSTFYDNATHTGRVAFTIPIKLDRNYVFAVTDSSKYNLNIAECDNDVLVPYPHSSLTGVEGYVLSDNDAYSTWTTSYETQYQDYVMIGLKKIPDAVFTEDELTNLIGTVLTVTAVE